MKFKLLGVITLSALSIGCTEDKEKEPTQHNLTVGQVRDMLESSFGLYYPTSQGLSCDGYGDGMSGCYILPCNSSSDTFSTRTIIGLGAEYLTAYTVNYETASCSGTPRMNYLNAGIWNYSGVYDENAQEAELTVGLEYYGDGYAFDTTRPLQGVTYKTLINIDEERKLCMSQDVIDPTRPLKIMELNPSAIDYGNCAVKAN